MSDQDQKPHSNLNLCEVSQQMMDQIFNPLIFDEDPTLPTKFISTREVAPFFFSGINSPFTPTSQEGLNLEIDGTYYNSVDRYVWEMKFQELTGSPPTSDNFRGTLKRRCVSMADLERWIVNRGILYLQKAILKKVQSDESFYKALMNTRNRYIFYTYMKDNFFATGKTTNEMKDWLSEIGSCNLYLRIPLRFPLHYQDLACTIQIPGGGHNVLGTIYMALRESIKTKGLNLLEVKIPELDNPIPEMVLKATSVNDKTSKKRDNEGKITSNLFISQQGTSSNYPGLQPLDYAQSITSKDSDTDSVTLRNTNPRYFSTPPSRAGSNASTPVSFFNSNNRQATKTVYGQPAAKQPKFEVKQEQYGETYSSMPTPSAYSVDTEVFHADNWHSEDQLEIVERVKAEKESEEEARRMLETPLDPTTVHLQQEAIEALNDQRLFNQLLTSRALSSRRTNSTATNTPATHRLQTIAETEKEDIRQKGKFYKPIKRELNDC